MFFVRDKDFDDALASPEALEKRLTTLRKTRKASYIAAVVSMIVFFGLVFLNLSIATNSPKANTSGPVINTVVMLCLAVVQAIATLSIQGEIRSLMVYKRMLEKTAPRQNEP